MDGHTGWMVGANDACGVVTYILPPSPSLFKDPKLRSLQLWEFSKQYFMEFWQYVLPSPTHSTHRGTTN